MWDWRWPLADIRKEIRDARAAGETVTALHKLEHLLDLLHDQFERLESEDKAKVVEGLTSDVRTLDDRANKDVAEKVIEARIRIITAAYDKASAYTNLIVLAGYASFFGLWSLTREYLNRDQALWAALLMLVSAAVFVMFEVYKMNVTQRSLAAQYDEMNQRLRGASLEALLEGLTRIEDDGRKRTADFMGAANIALVFAVGTALAAVLTLGYAFVAGLMAGVLL